LRDIAFKVVGVGSVGTFCAIGLFMSDDDAPLLLQIKEAQESVLAPFAGPSDYPNHGQRVVVGQRMLQAASDVFLGWTQEPIDGRYFYVRRLKDQGLADIGARLEAALSFYAGLCGRTLARAHARSGDAVSLSGYIGDTTEFDKAIAEFARAYADQTQQDWRALHNAIAAGRISAEDPPSRRELPSGGVFNEPTTRAAQVRGVQDRIRTRGEAGSRQTEKGAGAGADGAAKVTIGPGLGDVLNLALEKWQPRALQGRGAVFGAAGARGLGGDPELEGLVRSLRTRSSGEPLVETLVIPMQRMFGTAIGEPAVKAVGDETRTLTALQRLSVEAMADALRLTGQVGDAERLLVMPGEDRRPPVLMLMSPKVADVWQSRIISGELDLPLPVLWKAMQDLADPGATTPEEAALLQVLSGGPATVAEVFLIAQPEIVLTRLPEMIRLCVASPHLKIKSEGKVSTAGVLCRDKDGDFGVTGCYHGTGPVGTEVTVDLQKKRVKRASEVQDIVFIPLGRGFEVRQMVGLSGALEDREPAKADHVRFDGAINQNRQTRIFSTDHGLLRARPTVQLRLQTDPDTDQGDSGSALLDQNDCVLGFAFERTAYTDYPQFTDWIWAANALRALELKLYRAGD
jgi:hypothetical protein